MIGGPDYRSTSQRRLFRECGEKYLLRYLRGWRLKTDKGRFLFGTLMQRVADLCVISAFDQVEDAAQGFLAAWEELKNRPDLTWSKRETWEYFKPRGMQLARVCYRELPLFIRPAGYLVELDTTYVLGPGCRERVIPDVLADVRERRAGAWGQDFVRSVLDYKTSGTEYEDTAAEIDEQLTDGQLGVLEGHGARVAQVGLVVMVYTGEPRLQWLMEPARDAEEVARFRHGALTIDRLIREEAFFRNDRACDNWGGCEMRPLCFRSLRGQADATLKRDERKVGGYVEEWAE